MEFVRIRREQLPVAYHSRRAQEEPLPDLSVPVCTENDSEGGEEDEHSIAELVETVNDMPLTNDMLNDPLANAAVKEEDLTVFQLNAADRDEVDGLLDEIESTEVLNKSLPEQNLPSDTSATSSAGAQLTTEIDEDLIFVGGEMPMPMTSMRNGMLKQENDTVSGGLPFKPTASFFNLHLRLQMRFPISYLIIYWFSNSYII